MSGICGVWRMGQTDPDIGTILSRLVRRGPDGTSQWCDGEVALGHTLLATTPEALVEKLPHSDPLSGCTITADVRLDNRGTLIAEFDLLRETRTIGDGELVLRAYLKWGEDCPRQLLGDFAFAIWDPRRQRLFCARDHMGMRQLIFHHAPGRLFAFATEAEALVAHPAVIRKVNEARIADYLDDLEGIDLSSTFFEEIFRLPPAHALTIDSAGLVSRRYWELRAGPKLKLGSDQAYAQAFLAVFTEAVRCRLRSAKPVGSMLSGGLDSGSVAATAGRLLDAEGKGPLTTFSAISPDAANCIETRTIHVAASLGTVDAQFVDHSLLGELGDEMMTFTEGTEPFDSSMTLIRAIYLAAHRKGVNVMLDGVGGDVALTAGSRAAQLLRHGRLLSAVREVQGEAHFWGRGWPVATTLSKAAWNAFVPAPLRALRRTIYTRMQNWRGHGAGLIDPEFAKRVALNERRERLRRHSPSGILAEPAQRARSITHPYLVVARERYDRVAAAMAIEPRDPFLDLRLLDFCLSLPSVQLQADGWPKIILRRAMIDSLPAEVLWRRGKEHLGWTFTKALFDASPSWGEYLQSGHERLRDYIAVETLGPGNQSHGKVLDMETQIRLFFLIGWIERIDSGNRFTEKVGGKV